MSSSLRSDGRLAAAGRDSCGASSASGTRPVFYFLNIGQRDQSRDPVPVVQNNERRNRRVFLFGKGRKINKIGMVDSEARTRSSDDHKRSEFSHIDNLGNLFSRHTESNSAIDFTVFFTEYCE